MSNRKPNLAAALAWIALALGVAAVLGYGVWTTHAPKQAPEGAATLEDDETADDLRRAWALLGASASRLDQLAADPQRLQLAEGLIEGVLERRPQLAEAHRLRGVLALARGQLDAARSSFETCLELDPDRLPALLSLGAVHAEREDHAAAEAVFRRAVEAHPRSIEALHNLGQTLWLLGRQTEAMEVYRRKVELQQGLMIGTGPPPAAPATTP